MRARVTIRGKGVELRGFVDYEDEEELAILAQAVEPFGLVVASPVDPNYNPFKE